MACCVLLAAAVASGWALACAVSASCAWGRPPRLVPQRWRLRRLQEPA
jgi:hypothetical protein